MLLLFFDAVQVMNKWYKTCVICLLNEEEFYFEESGKKVYGSRTTVT